MGKGKDGAMQMAERVRELLYVLKKKKKKHTHTGKECRRRMFTEAIAAIISVVSEQIEIERVGDKTERR